MPKRYVADFETTTWEKDKTRVWAYAICEIDNLENIIIGNNIESFMKFCENEKNPLINFHNLKFDGEFIIYYLLKNGYKHITKNDERVSRTFKTLISDLGMFYQIEVYFEVNGKNIKKVTFRDSLKVLPFSVDDLAKTFHLSISKLELDYNKPRRIGHILTKEERDYIKNDVLIVATALKILYDAGMKKMTIGSNAVSNYKSILGCKFDHYFKELDKRLDSDLRQSYRGGFTYLNPLYKNKDVSSGITLDVNSLYPYVMHDKPMPFDYPIFFEGKYVDDKIYNLYIQKITCSFKIKKNKIPMIQIKHGLYKDNEYLTTSKNSEGEDIVSLTLTNVDLKLFFEQYEVSDLKYVCGWKFKSITGLFSKYIDYWTDIKIKSTIEKNYGMRTFAKLMLNSLYGKFATTLETRSKIPYLEDDIVKYYLSDLEDKKGMYIPVGAFITSYAREITIRTSQAITDYSLEKYGTDLYIYSDTDSISTLLPIDEVSKFCNIDSVKLGFWKHENTFTRAKFIRQKTYLKEIEGKVEITCAGMPKECYSYVEWNKFKEGFSCGGKLRFSHVKGGVLLVPTEFTIKKEVDIVKSMKGF